MGRLKYGNFLLFKNNCRYKHCLSNDEITRICKRVTNIPHLWKFYIISDIWLFRRRVYINSKHTQTKLQSNFVRSNLGGLCKFVRETGSSSQLRLNYYYVEHSLKGFQAYIGRMINMPILLFVSTSDHRIRHIKNYYQYNGTLCYM
jgi:hypothetical protein